MNDLFRFISIRGPQAAQAERAIPLTGAGGTTELQDALRPLRGTDDAFAAMAELARQYEASPAFADPSANLDHALQFAKFRTRLDELVVQPLPVNQSALAAAVTHAFDAEPETVVAGPWFATHKDRVHDSLVALFLAPATGRRAPTQEIEEGTPPTPPLDHAVPMRPLADLARAIDILERVAAVDTALHSAAALAAALHSTLLLPPTIFPVLPHLGVRPVGVADLRVVRQQLTRYEAGEVSEIHNLLAGESHSRRRKHTLSIEQKSEVETETTTEVIKDLKSTERFSLKQEIEKTLKDDLSVSGGVSVSTKFGKQLTVDANLDVAWTRSKEQTEKLSSDFAREITQRTASKISERVRIHEVSRTVESFLDQEDHAFDNSFGPNLRGVYQWLNKVYTAQVFNYGKRLMFDISVPEPAAFLLSTLDVAAAAGRPTPPIPFTLNGVNGPPLRPYDFSRNPADLARYYQRFAGRYGAEDVEAPPAAEVVVAKAITASDPSENNDRDLLIPNIDSLKIPDGYTVERIRVHGTSALKQYTSIEDGGNQIDVSIGATIVVFIGPVAFHCYHGENAQDEQREHAYVQFDKECLVDPTKPEFGSISLGISTYNVQSLSLAIELVCTPTATAIEGWELRAYNTILQAYEARLADFRDRMTAFVDFADRPLGEAVALGGHPEQNRAIERRELKRSALEVLVGKNLVDVDRGAVDTTPPTNQVRAFPRAILEKVEADGAYARFFEQAFEWEQMTYLFYPYFWGRLSTWYDKALMAHGDPSFLEFLRAGAARVAVPVRPGFEEAIQYFLMTGQIWGGGELPGVTDTTYLPIAEEIREVTGAPGAEKPEGEPWEIVLPTQLVKLRAYGTLPTWSRPYPDQWKWQEDLNPPY